MAGLVLPDTVALQWSGARAGGHKIAAAARTVSRRQRGFESRRGRQRYQQVRPTPFRVCPTNGQYTALDIDRRPLWDATRSRDWPAGPEPTGTGMELAINDASGFRLIT
jgi:hypothetical protein